jgi:hypothetical protein
MKNNPVQNIARDLVTFYVTKSQIALTASILGIGFVSIAPAQAASFTYSGNTTGAPTWNPPAAATSPLLPQSFSRSRDVPYEAFEFSVDTSGTYTFSSVNSFLDCIEIDTPKKALLTYRLAGLFDG